MIHISYRGKALESDQLRKMGWSLVDAATALDRYKLQLAQSKLAPDDEEERGQADRAASRVLAANRKIINMIKGLQG